MKVEGMLIHGKQIMLAAFIASAIGMSCTACLSTSGIHNTPAVQPPGIQQPYLSTDAADPLRITLNTASVTPAVQIPDPQKPQTVQFSANSYVSAHAGRIETSPLGHPVGKVSGIDLAAAQFAQSNYQGTIPPLQYKGSFQQEAVRTLDAGYTFVANTDDTGLGLDLAVRPRISLNEQGDVRTTRAGAEVRIGQNLDLRGQNAKNSNWYLFAGADGEAIIWDVQRGGGAFADDEFTLQDKVTVGDVQAGIAFQSPAGQMSVSYIQRDFEYRNGAISRSGEEEFAAITLTWRR
jgi:hypothetical protein